MDWTQILISAITGLISGTLASLVAPWVNWGVERRRGRLNTRQSLLADARSTLIFHEYDNEAFRDTAEYSRLKPYLSQKIISLIESHDNSNLAVVMKGRHAGANNLKNLILDEISNLERKWKLI